MHDWRDLLPVGWIAAAIAVLVVGAAATYGVLTVTEPEAAPAPELVAEVQGIPPSGGNPCWWLNYSRFAALNENMTSEHRQSAMEEAADEFDEAAKDLSGTQTESIEVMSQFFGDELANKAAISEFDLVDEVSTQVPQTTVDEFISVLDC